MSSSEEGIGGCYLEFGALTKAIEHLNRAFNLLVEIKSDLAQGTVNFIELTGKLSDVWNEINNCRIYTQDITYFEELLIPAMGFVNDAKMMLESLVYWKLGMTRHGRISMLSSIREAIADGIGPGIVELEYCLGAF